MQSTSSAQRSRSYPSHRERRKTLRISEPFPVRVRGMSVAGHAFDEETSLSNVSAGGLFVRMSHRVDVGRPVFALMQLSLTPSSEGSPCVAARGTVLRVQHYADDSYGVAVKISQHRFL